MANKSMGEIISTLRKEKGLTQKEVADRLNITDKAVSKWSGIWHARILRRFPNWQKFWGYLWKNF